MCKKLQALTLSAVMWDLPYVWDLFW